MDAALYDLDSVAVADALIEAHQRGPKCKSSPKPTSIVEKFDDTGKSVFLKDDQDPDSYMHQSLL